MKNARKKLEVSVEAAMPLKVSKTKCKETCTGPAARKSKYA